MRERERERPAAMDTERLSNIVVAVVLALSCVVLIAYYLIRTHVTDVDTSSQRQQQAVEQAIVDEDVLFDNLMIGDVDISGMTVAAAREKVEAYMAPILDTPIALVVSQNKRVEVTLNQLSASWGNPQVLDELLASKKGTNVIQRYKLSKDMAVSGNALPLEISLDKEKAIEFLQKNCSIYDVEMTASEMITEGGVAKLKLGNPGEVLNLSESVSALQNRGFEAVKNGEAEFILPIEEQYPSSIPEGYEDYPGIADMVLQAEAEAAAKAAEEAVSP